MATATAKIEEPYAVHIVARTSHLPLHLRQARLLDDDELYEFCRINRELRIERTKEGDIIIMSPTGADTGRRNFNLIVQLGSWALRDGSGVGFDSSTGFILPNGAERSPDAAWITRPRWEGLTDEQRRKFAPLCPDFVVEIRSPSDDLTTLLAKLDEYIENGARLVWLIDPELRRVVVRRPGEPVQELEDPRTVSGDPVLPGFELVLEQLW